ncbi:MAG: copper-binding protein [Candidatus Marinimicrobia bacterium]|nr:copper-binding protein [Candidatus Neomarinimicrobiota bacterium]
MRSALVLLCTFFICCESDQQTYAVRGTIRSITLEQNRVTIAHDTIPDLMMPMVMPFPVIDQDELKDIGIGDSVHFEFVWTDPLPYAREFKIIGQGHVPKEDDFFDDEFSEIGVGQILDDVTLLSLDSSEVNLSDSDGRYRFISYVFTRCPMPNMCPAVVMKNRYLVDRFSDMGSIDFILVSFDHKYDTPSVLRQTYGSSAEGHKNLRIWSSTGHVDDVYRLVKQSGGDFWGVEEERIGHTLRSVLIGPERELLASWKGEDWKVEHVERAMEMFIK